MFFTLFFATGPAALDIAMVGAGQADAWFHHGVHCWDMAAGAVIVKEAGGAVISPDGSEFDLMSRCGLFASSEQLAAELSQVITQLAMESEYPEKCPALY